MRNTALRSSTALAMLLTALPAAAQVAVSPPTPPSSTAAPIPTGDQTADDAQVIESIVVTGSRFDEVLDQPTSVTLIDAERRNLVSINTTAQLVAITPGIFLSEFGLNIRGVGRATATSTLGSENSVALYVNGFYNIDPNTIGESTLFGGNVQFLRGPQGTRYGRDSIGGAANLIARSPTKEFRGEAVAAVGRGYFTNFGVNVSGPISDRYGVRIGVQKFNQPDSYFSTNIVPSRPAGLAANNFYVEFQFEGQPTDDLHFLLRSTHFSYDNKTAYTAPARYDVNGAFQGPLVPNAQYQYSGPVPDAPREINVDVPGIDRLRNNMVHILNADYDFGGAKLFYVGGYAQYESSGFSDFDATSRSGYIAGTTTNPATNTIAAPVVPGTFVSTNQVASYLNDNHYYSHELRLEGDVGKLRWIAGLYYLDMHYDETYRQSLPDVAALETPTAQRAGQIVLPNPTRDFFRQRNLYDLQSKAVFANAEYDVSDTLTLDVGARHTWDSKEALTNFRYVYYYPAAVTLDVTPVVNSVNPTIDNKGLTGHASLIFRPSASTNIFATYSRGYKAGSFTLGDVVTNNVTKPEHLNAYEIGVRQKFGPFTGDLTGFYYDYRDLQVPISAVTAIGAVVPQFTNAPRSRIYGLEAQATWQPSAALSITANYTYLNTRFLDFCPRAPGAAVCGAIDFTQTPVGGAPVPENLAGRSLPRTPRNKASLSGYYSIPTGNSAVIVGASGVYTGPQYVNAFQRANTRLDDFVVVNGTLTWRSADNRLDIVASVTNLFDTIYNTNVTIASRALGFAPTEFLGPPRFYSLTARTRF